MCELPAVSYLLGEVRVDTELGFNESDVSHFDKDMKRIGISCSKYYFSFRNHLV